MVITSKCFFVRLRKRRPSSMMIWPFGSRTLRRHRHNSKQKRLPDARHEFHADHIDVPAQERSIGRSHAKTNDQCRSGPLAKKTEWKIANEFCNRRQVGDANAVDEESFFHTSDPGM